jgi:Transposase IS66 family
MPAPFKVCAISGLLQPLAAQRIFNAVRELARRTNWEPSPLDPILPPVPASSCDRGLTRAGFRSFHRRRRSANGLDRRDPPDSKAPLQARFDGIFTQTTGFVTLDRLLARLHANKPELLMVLERPEIPLHTNTSENDVRCHVTRRKISGGTRSDRGRARRDAFLGLVKTCAKHAISFWDYLRDRLAVPDAQAIPQLPELILAKAQGP